MKEMLYDPIIISCILSIFITQFIKVSTSKKPFVNSIFDSGGMPSSHAALVTALTISVFFAEGFSTLFIVVVFFSALVLHDAVGVRWVTGEQSKAINKIIKTQKISMDEVKVLMGHTFSQVIVGMVIGGAIAIIAGVLL